MICAHKEPDFVDWADVEVSPYGDTEPQLVTFEGKSWFEDIGIGAFRCTRCGETRYYTGHWKNFYEKGITCLGSDRAQPLPQFKAP